MTSPDWRQDEPAAESSCVDEVYHQILLRIVRGECTGGAELKSTQLAQAMGVSRTPVVQALQRLAADGIVTLEMNRRAVVRPGAENWLVELHLLRELLEPAAAALAAQRITDAALGELQQLADSVQAWESRQAASTDPSKLEPDWQEAYRRFDYGLHLAIAAHCDNLPLTEAIRRCWSYKRLSYEAASEKPEALRQGHREHLLILQALQARDPQSASAAMVFHLRSASRMRPSEKIV